MNYILVAVQVVLLFLMAFLLSHHDCEAFHYQHTIGSPLKRCHCRSSLSPLFSETQGNMNNDDDKDDAPSSLLNLQTFKRRREQLQRQTRQRQWQQPPNPLLENPIQFVQALLESLRGETLPPEKRGGASAALVLLESSTPAWRNVLVTAVGAPSEVRNKQVDPALQAALEQPDNQFAILVMKRSDTAKNSSQWHFPSDPVDFQDGMCWVESRLRDVETDQLLVVVGWSLKQRASDGSWLLDGVDWQDFREEFRPGIGREEWERICG